MATNYSEFYSKLETETLFKYLEHYENEMNNGYSRMMELSTSSGQYIDLKWKLSTLESAWEQCNKEIVSRSY